VSTLFAINNLKIIALKIKNQRGYVVLNVVLIQVFVRFYRSGSITTLGKGTIPFVLLMLMIEGGSGTTINIFFRCFVDKKGMETKLKRRLHFVMFCFLTCYIGFVNGLWSNILAAAFPLPCRFHKKGDPYCLLAIKLAELLCFRFR
ncbi:unnamed protein product, partial [Brassica napus]